MTERELRDEIEQLTQKNDRLLTLLRHLFPEKSGEFFICGKGGERDAQGLPDYIMICPTYGADVGNMSIYHKEKK